MKLFKLFTVFSLEQKLNNLADNITNIKKQIEVRDSRLKQELDELADHKTTLTRMVK